MLKIAPFVLNSSAWLWMIVALYHAFGLRSGNAVLFSAFSVAEASKRHRTRREFESPCEEYHSRLRI